MEETGISDEELFSMDDLEKGLKKGRGARRLPWLTTGLVLGIAGTIVLPRVLAPYLPDSLRGDREILSGPVLGVERDGDRLLLTIHAEPGAFIASFSERVAEIDLLVDVGDTVTVSVTDYEPFIENPDFEGVRKSSGTTPEPGEAAPAPEEVEGDDGRAESEGRTLDEEAEGDDGRTEVEGDDGRAEAEGRTLDEAAEGDDGRAAAEGRTLVDDGEDDAGSEEVAEGDDGRRKSRDERSGG